MAIALVAVYPVMALGQVVPTGKWLTEDHKAVVAVERCGTSFCGRLVGLVLDRPTDSTPVDNQGRSQCGLTIIADTTSDGTSGWATHITDPRNGRVYTAKMQVDDKGRLRVRGYLLLPILGETQVWTPFPGPLPADCRLTSQP